MNLKKYAFVALALVSFAACKKNNSNNPEQQSTGEDTKISLSLSIASSGAKTYAPDDDDYDYNAEVAELNMNTVDIFIYDKVSPFALTHKHLAGNAYFEDGNNGERVLKGDIVLDAKTGDKLIYVGVNLPPIYVSEIKAKGLTSLEELFNTMGLYDGSRDNLLSSGMPMFTNEGIETKFEKTLGGVIPSGNKIGFALTRMLAKVTVDGTTDFNATQALGNPLPVVGGKIEVSSLKYSLKQVNEKTYLKGNKVVAWEEELIFFNREAISEVLGTVKYAPENRAENDLIRLTYAVVEARFIPEVFEDETGSPYEPGDNFFTITDPSNGSVKYYKNEVNAEADFDENKEFRVYMNGKCYYHIYLNPENDHKIVRNEYYQVKISTIRGIGKSSSQNIKKFEDKWYHPELIAPGNIPNTLYSVNVPQPVTTNANIEAIVTIKPWKLKASEIEL